MNCQFRPPRASVAGKRLFPFKAEVPDGYLELRFVGKVRRSRMGLERLINDPDRGSVRSIPQTSKKPSYTVHLESRLPLNVSG